MIYSFLPPPPLLPFLLLLSRLAVFLRQSLFRLPFGCLTLHTAIAVVHDSA